MLSSRVQQTPVATAAPLAQAVNHPAQGVSRTAGRNSKILWDFFLFLGNNAALFIYYFNLYDCPVQIHLCI